MLSCADLKHLARGASILGSGGGGCPNINLLMTLHQFESCGGVELVSVEDLTDDALVVPLANVGAPLVGIERLARGDECDRLIDAIENHYGRKVSAVFPAEIGGGNALLPLAVAARKKIPVLDGDTIGRAFPKLNMSTCSLFGVDPAPAFVVGAIGEPRMIAPEDACAAERIIRQIALENGMRTTVAIYIMSGKEAKRAVISGSISRAIRLGRQMKNTEVKHLASGSIIALDQRIEKGFLQGSVRIEGGVEISFQNEYLIAKKNGECLAATPDILTLLHRETGEPILSDRLRYGLRVDLVTMRAPEVWYSEKGLNTVGPQVFSDGFV